MRRLVAKITEEDYALLSPNKQGDARLIITRRARLQGFRIMPVSDMIAGGVHLSLYRPVV